MVAEPAGELPEIRKRRNEIEIGANLCLSYRFAPILYRYGLSTVYEYPITGRKGDDIYLLERRIDSGINFLAI